MSKEIKIKMTKTRPKKAGFYLCLRKDAHKPELAEIREDDYQGLLYLGAISIYPLKENIGSLWSSEIIIDKGKEKS